MKGFITLLLLLMGITATTVAQDLIVLKTGSEIKSKVIELTPTEVKYKAFDNLDGPTITIGRATVFMCRYANGKTELITPLEQKTVEHPPIENVKNVPTKAEETTITEKNDVQITPSVSSLKKASVDDKKTVNNNFTGNFFIGVAIPYSNYANKNLINDKKAAGAKLGFISGFELGHRFSNDFSLICEGQYAFNSYEIQVEDLRNIYSLQGDWTHISVMPGLKFEIPLKKISLYTVTSAGMSFTTVDGDFADVLDVLDTKSNSTSFVYSLTTGLIFNKTISLGFKTTTSNPAFGNYKMRVSNLLITVGYQF